MKRAIIFTFPRPLTRKEEDYFISAFQESVVKPTNKEIRKQSNNYSKGLYGKIVDRTGANAIVMKLQILARGIEDWIKLEKETDTRYSFIYEIDVLSSLTLDMPKMLQPTVGKKLVIGKFIPDRRIIRFFQKEVFPEMHLKAKEVQIENIML